MTERKPTVGILAYGSLIDDPGDELSRLIVQKIEHVATPFPVEFARSSSSRGGAPTLVPYARGARVSATILVLDSSPEQAADMLWRRETRCLDTTRRYPGPKPKSTNAVQVECLAELSGVDHVLYTSISPNFAPLTAERLAELAIASVAKARPGLDGISYLISAKANGIITELSPSYEARILLSTGTHHLEGALAILRDGLLADAGRKLGVCPKPFGITTDPVFRTETQLRQPSAKRAVTVGLTLEMLSIPSRPKRPKFG